MEKLGDILPKAIQGETLPENTGNSCEDQPCNECGAMVKPVLLPVSKTWVYPACRCEIAKYQQQEADRMERERKSRIERLFNNSGLGPRFESCCLDNWKKRPGTEDAFEITLDYEQSIAERIREGSGFLIFGQPGNGKSHLAAAVVRTALQKGYSAIFERVPKLLARIRATYQGGDVTEYQIMKALTEANLLVLDDAGAEKWTEWTEPTLYTIIDERYTHQKALIVTTNSDLDGLEKKIGPRAMDRLLEMCQIVENRGSSYRQEVARKRR